MHFLFKETFTHENNKVHYTIKIQDNKVVDVYREESNYSYSIDHNSEMFKYYETKYNK
jgi:hypothetical protein